MIYFLGLIIGFLNGFFTSGAGQVLVFYLVFIKKLETHKSRALCVFVLCISSIISLIFLFDFPKINFFEIIFIIISSILFGVIGTKIMKNINSNILNLISGILLVVLSVIRFINLR